MKFREEAKTQENLEKLAKAAAYISRQCDTPFTHELGQVTVNWDKVIYGGKAMFAALQELGLLVYTDCADLHWVGLNNIQFPDQHRWDQKRWAKEIAKVW